MTLVDVSRRTQFLHIKRVMDAKVAATKVLNNLVCFLKQKANFSQLMASRANYRKTCDGA